MGTENRSSVLLQRYELGRLLGQGTFAKVFFARNIRSSQSVAIKVIEKQKVLKNGLIDQIKREISVMRLVRHPNVVRLHEVMATKTKIYFVLEYVRGGELFNKVSRGRLREEDAKKYFQQLIGAVHFCHGRGAFHRDLKPENLLLDDDGNLKVSDFGLSALADSKRRDGLLHTACGTPAYVAPEVINGNGYDGAKADIWSCGVILFVLMAGYLPFNDSNLLEMYRKIEKAEFRFPNWFPPDVRRLIRRILDPNPAARIAIEEIKANPWFSNGLAVERVELAPAEGEQETGKPINLNAFDIISLSAGFDLSGLFEEGDGEREARFASNKPVSAIIAKLEEVAGRLSLKIKKKDGGVLRMEGSKEGRKGVLAIDAEIFEVIPSLHMVEIRKTSGDTMEYQKLWKQDMRPALEEIEWVRQGGRTSLQPPPSLQLPPPRQLGPASGGGDLME